MFASMTDDDTAEIPRLSLSHEASRQRLVSPELDRLKAAFERVSDMPEHKTDERARWLELRQAAELYLRRWG